jgi:hypothetical protein
MNKKQPYKSFWQKLIEQVNQIKEKELAKIKRLPEKEWENIPEKPLTDEEIDDIIKRVIVK